MEILNLFSTPVYKNNLTGKDFSVVQEEILKSLEEINFVDTNKLNSELFDPLNTKVSSNIEDSNFLYEYNCTNMIQFISDSVVSYLKDIGLRGEVKFEISNSWITCIDNKHHIQTHHHEGVGISGIYYYKTNGEDGNLFLSSPTKYMQISNIFKRCNPNQSFEIIPENGMIVLFPSWIDHGVRSNMTDDERMSIAFNINFR